MKFKVIFKNEKGIFETQYFMHKKFAISFAIRTNGIILNNK